MYIYIYYGLFIYLIYFLSMCWAVKTVIPGKSEAGSTAEGIVYGKTLSDSRCQNCKLTFFGGTYVILKNFVFLLNCSLKCAMHVYCFFFAQSVPPAIILINKRK